VTKRLVSALVVVMLIAQPLHAGFAEVARALDAQKGVDRIWIPFLGLARFFVRMAAPEGVHDFQLVTFTGGEKLESRDVQRIMREKMGAGFVPLVQVRSRKSREWSFIYARPSKKADRFELVMLVHDHEDTVLVRLDIDAEMLAREMNEHPRNVTSVARR
jgi:hypothetical protein